MYKIIGGKRYDTETAKFIATNNTGAEDQSDFHWSEEKLYRKSSGEFFLHCAGGPATQYATSQGNGYGYGECIKPLTYAQAMDWSEENMSGEEVEKYFIVEEEKKIKTFSISGKADETLKNIAAFRNMKKSEIVEELITAEGKRLGL